MDRVSSVHKNISGIAALVVVIMLGVISLSIAVTFSFLGVGEARMSFIADKGAEALAVADGCMEDTFERIRRDTTYIGAQVPTVAGGSCVIMVMTPFGYPTLRTIVVEGVSGEYHKKIEANISISVDSGGNNIAVNYWKEIST